MQSLSEKYITDEETDSDNDTTLVKRSLSWRSTKCDQFLRTLDDRYAESREKITTQNHLSPEKLAQTRNDWHHKMLSLGQYFVRMAILRVRIDKM